MADKDNIMNLEGDELDKALMAAIDETEEEEKQQRLEKAKLEQERSEARRIEAEQKEEEKKRLEEARKKLPNEGRRFYILTEDEKETRLESSVEVQGTVGGTIKTGDEIYIYRKDGKVIPSTVKALFTLGADESKNETQEASNCRAAVQFEVDLEKAGFKDEAAVPMFSVITGIKPATGDIKRAPVENPLLLGLTLSYNKYKENPEYLKTFLTALVQGRFAVPARDSGNNPQNGKKKLQIITLKKNPDDTARTLPLFTDLAALSMGSKAMFDEQHKPTIIVMNFAEVKAHSEKDTLDVILNPFGPVGITIPKKMLDSIRRRD